MGTRPRKRFGQNFLQDDSIIDRIIDSIAPAADDTVVEIGPGKGALTYPLLESNCKLHAIELDRDLVSEWRQRELDGLTIHEGDALKFNFSDIKPAPLRLVGNLPYNISTPLLFHFMSFESHFQDLHVMLQKEVAERICAKPGTRAYGRLGIMLSIHFESDILFDVPPESFHPAPKVVSSVIRMTPSKPSFTVDDPSMFARVVKQAFSMRRKTLRKSLQSLCDDRAFSDCNIDSKLRPEVLDPSQFADLANYLAARPPAES